MESFVTLVNGYKPLITFKKLSNLDNCGSYHTALITIILIQYYYLKKSKTTDTLNTFLPPEIQYLVENTD